MKPKSDTNYTCKCSDVVSCYIILVYKVFGSHLKTLLESPSDVKLKHFL